MPFPFGHLWGRGRGVVVGTCMQGRGWICPFHLDTSGRRSAVADTVAASAGYAISVQKRKLIEQGFGWAKTVGCIRQVMVRGLKRVDQIFVLTMAAYNLTRMRTLGQIRVQKV